jgi:adenosylcobyric acid synthase
MQMLGREIADPHGIEGAAGSVAGFGWLDFSTTLTRDKTLENVTGWLVPGVSGESGGTPIRSDVPVSGYEIHMGETDGPALASPALRLATPEGGERPDGALSADGQILATYVHGLFDTPAACAALLAWAGLAGAQRVDYAALREASLERVADTLAEHLDLARLFAAIRAGSHDEVRHPV